MKMAPFEYHCPTTLDEAVDVLAEHGSEAKVLAGGQSLLALLALRLARPAHLVDIGRVQNLDGLSVEADGTLMIGAAVRHATVGRSELAAAAQPLLTSAIPHIGHRAIRTRGTVCGSLAHADPAAELPAVAVALDADVMLRSRRGERAVPARRFFRGFLSTDAADDEVITAVRIPPHGPNHGFSVQEVTRRHGDFAVIGVAVALEFTSEPRICRAALAYFGAGSTPVPSAAAERVLTNETPSEALFHEAAETAASELQPPSDNHGSAAYRTRVAAVLTRRGLIEASAQAGVTV